MSRGRFICLLNTRPTPLACRQSGAAMVEFIIAAVFLLIPLYLAIQALGKFADVKHMTQAGARYAAWERSVWFNETRSDFYQHNQPNQKSAQEIQREIRVRLLNDRSSTLRYQDTDKKPPKKESGNDKQTLRLDPLWSDTAGKPFLSDYEKQVAMGEKHEKPKQDLLGAALDLVNKVSIPHVTGSLFPPVPTQNLAVASFEFKDVAKDSETYKRLWNMAYAAQAGQSDGNKPREWPGITTQAQAAVLTNAWNANSSQGAKAMVQASVPTAQALGKVIETGAKVTLYAWQPTLGLANLAGTQNLEMGKVGVDVVPDDRLK